MAQTRENLFNPSSPHPSSGGPGSFKGTPDTRFTTFSPDGSSANSTRPLDGISRSASATSPVSLPVRGFHSNSSPLDKDPFVTPGPGTRLSPTASAFKPFSSSVPTLPTSDHGLVATVLSTDLGLSRVLDVSHPARVSASDVEVWLSELDAQGIQSHGQRSVKVGTGNVFVQFDDIRDACSVHASSCLGHKGWKLDFANPATLTKGDLTYRDTGVSHSSQVLVLAAVQPGQLADADVLQAAKIVKNTLQQYGQLFAFIRLPATQDGSFKMIAEYCNASAAPAAVAACANSSIVEGFHVTMSLYSSKLTPTNNLSGVFQGTSFNNGHNELERQRNTHIAMSPRPASEATTVHFQPPAFMYPLMFQTQFAPNMSYMVDKFPRTGQTSPMDPMSPTHPIIGPPYQAPPSPALTSQNSQSPSRPLPGYCRPDSRRQNATRVSRSPHHNPASHHNHVDIQRIRGGIDVRTTIMLRNIPNKVDQAMLKRIVDESSWGKYDFMYLRIDFANDCNVGYAFINFVDPLDIIDVSHIIDRTADCANDILQFVDARGNQRWNCFKSDKVAEISYATIQGKDCLVQKFRNSSVMLEAPHYRPKLYFTSNGPMPELAGREEPFPEPDNQSKMKRSCENAEHVGLFTPNAGQHFRDEQRRRRSQYDRGTRLAALEEYDYETAIHLYGSTAQ